MLNLGNIYPPLEVNSMFVRVTKGCSWNKCIFCDSYQDSNFEIRDIDEILNDVNVILHLQRTSDPLYTNTYSYEIAQKWKNSKRIFLQDCDVLCIRNLAEIISKIKEKTNINSFSCYSSVSNLKYATKELFDLGLDKLYIGLETGSQKVLKLINKRHFSQDIEHAKHAQNIGFQLYEHYIVGIGGKLLSHENALKTAEFLNELNPHAIEIRTTIVIPGTKLSELKNEGSWLELSDNEKDEELKLFLENLDFNGFIYSNHSCNRYQHFNGRFRENKQNFLDELNGMLSQ